MDLYKEMRGLKYGSPVKKIGMTLNQASSCRLRFFCGWMSNAAPTAHRGCPVYGHV